MAKAHPHLLAMRPLLYVLLSVLLTRYTRKDITTDEISSEYDFIIVGGGTAGSAVASRLSEVANWRILVLEAGNSDIHYPGISIPQDFLDLQRTSLDWNYPIITQQHYEDMPPDQTELWPRGKVLGGSSSINAMMYIRGSPHDFDSWEDHGAEGWAWKDIRKYFRKSEDAHGPDMSDELGRGGPLKITRRFLPKMHGMLMETAKSLGYNITDYSEKLEGIDSIIATIYEGIRQNAAAAYLYSVLPERSERLHVAVNALVTKIVFEQKDGQQPKAIGVDYIKGGSKKFVKAKNEVIVCTGAIETPHLLMVSGIGPKKHLQDMEIDVISDLPGVGSNLQDHPMFWSYFYATNMSRKLLQNSAMMKDRLPEYITQGTGPWITPYGHTTNLHIRTGLDKISSSTKNRPFPDLQLVFLTADGEILGFGPRQDTETAKHISLCNMLTLAHPKSSGKVWLKSKDPHERPLIDPKFLENEDDLDMLVEGLHRVEQFETTALFRELDAKMIMPSECKKFHEENAPRKDELYRCLLRAGITTDSHPCCTAKIGGRNDDIAVVDSRLRVYGVNGLRVADASVMPHITSANIQAVCYMIGEKAADVIKEEWGIVV